MRALTSVLVSRAELASQAGLTFEGARDTYAVLGYPRVINLEMYRERYERDDIAAAVVERPPEATWRGGGELIEDDDPTKVTDFEQAWIDLDERLHVWPTFANTDVIAGLGRFAVIFIGAPGNTESELPTMSDQEEIMYLTPFPEDSIEELTLVTDPKNPRFGLPDYYRVKGLTAAGTATGSFRKQVHWSRIIHIADRTLENALFGQPRLKRVWNDLDNLDKVIGGGSEAFWLRAHPGMQVDIDKELDLGKGEEDRLEAEIDEYQHQIRRVMRTRGTKINVLDAQIANFDGPASAILKRISAGSHIPLRILLGSERGELASTQDRDNWYDYISDRRKLFAEPRVVRAFVDRLMKYGALPEVPEYEVRWSQIKSMDDSTKADLGIKWSTINRNMGDIVVTPDEIRDRLLGWSPLSPAERKKWEKEVAPVPGAGSGGQPVAKPPAGTGPTEVGKPPAAAA